jgi:gluconokinase
MIGIDIGTTSTKTIIFTANGDILSQSSIGYPMIHPEPSWMEQDPNEIYNAVLRATGEAVERLAPQKRKGISGISLSVAMHSLIIVDSNSEPLTRSIVWGDGRSAKEAELLKRSEWGPNIYRNTGTPIHPMSPLTKIIWFKNHQPTLFSKAYKFISIKEYILHRWFGQYVVDYSIASATGMFHLQNREWDETALQVAGIDSNQLSELVSPLHRLKGMNAEAAEQLGVEPDIEVVIGASDGALANLGTGAIGPGDMAITIGTSGAIRMTVSAPLTDPSGRTFCYALTDQLWVMGGATNNGALALDWFKKELLGMDEDQTVTTSDSYEHLAALAEQSSPGANGLVFLPYLTGERAPHWNSNARGTFFGIALHHQKADFVRAVLEGVIYSLRSVEQAMLETGINPTKIFASGGFARIPVWRQILADVLGKEVFFPESHDSSCWGAALLGFHSLGIIPDLSQARKPDALSHKPNMQTHQRYSEYQSLFNDLYIRLEPCFNQVIEFQRANR